jgi:hypothetical protein
MSLSPIKNVNIKTYKTIVLTVVLYGCETWFVTLRKVHKLWVLEKKAMRTTFGTKHKEVTESWGKLHNE